MKRHDDSLLRSALLASLVVALGAFSAGCAKHGANDATVAAHAPANRAPAEHADHAGHDAAHDTTAGAAIDQLALDAGHKWATDPPLRAGMAAIHGAFDAEHAAIDAGTLGDAQYEALAGRIDGAVQDIIRNCKLPPAADANLHYVIADLARGAQEMRGGDPARTRREGAVRVHRALDAYGRFFDDPAFGAATQLP